MDEASARVVQVLSGSARFVPEVAHRAGVARAELEQVLVDLEGSGRVLVRDQWCADPHLEGTDLRIVALIDGEVADAIGAIDARWQAWLADYLATHRCL